MPKPICYGISSKLWYGLTRLFKSNLSLRSATHARQHQPVVIAVGGNSLAGAEKQTVRNIMELAKSHRVVITHGNGPQVGDKLAGAEATGLVKSLGECTRETQVEIGQELREGMQKVSGLAFHALRPEVIQTYVIVDPKDPAFQRPTKYIGQEFSWDEIGFSCTKGDNDLFNWHTGSLTYQLKQVPGKPGILRRVVPSPKPISIHPDNLRDIKRAIFLGKMVIAAGGGGIPVLPDGSPVEAVIDKDLATALLCREIKARSLIISTGVRHVAHNFQNPFQEDILYYQLQDALWNLRRGQYPAGAMGEKIEAVINALRFGVNSALITHPEARWINNEGTTITRGLDLSGRLYNLIRFTGLISRDLQRWLVT